MSSRTASTLLLLAAICLAFALPAAHAITVLGTGNSALLGGDLTDPEDDGNDSSPSGSNFNWLSTAASSENNFGDEGALDVFDGEVGSGSAKWCCDGSPQWVAVELDRPYVLTHFTIAAGNDSAPRDPTDWVIEGSDDGSAWTTIYHWTAGVSPFSNRLEVVRFDGDNPLSPHLRSLQRRPQAPHAESKFQPPSKPTSLSRPERSGSKWKHLFPKWDCTLSTANTRRMGG
jgi:hypothetical protein